MTLRDMIKALDDLSDEELGELLDQIEHRLVPSSLARGSTPQERIRRLNAAASAIREGFSDEEWAEVVRAMSEEYVESMDDMQQWKD
ncbi:MAG: hypothetical protein ABI835_19015 [Chloroflexota bacterium]